MKNSRLFSFSCINVLITEHFCLLMIVWVITKTNPPHLLLKIEKYFLPIKGFSNLLCTIILDAKIKNQPKYVTILQLPQDYHKKAERLIKTFSLSGHLYSDNWRKELFIDLKTGVTMILYFNFLRKRSCKMSQNYFWGKIGKLWLDGSCF